MDSVNKKYDEIMKQVKELDRLKKMYKNKAEWYRMMHELRIKQYLLEELLEIE